MADPLSWCDEAREDDYDASLSGGHRERSAANPWACQLGDGKSQRASQRLAWATVYSHGSQTESSQKSSRRQTSHHKDTLHHHQVSPSTTVHRRVMMIRHSSFQPVLPLSAASAVLNYKTTTDVCLIMYCASRSTAGLMCLCILVVRILNFAVSPNIRSFIRSFDRLHIQLGLGCACRHLTADVFQR